MRHRHEVLQLPQLHDQSLAGSAELTARVIGAYDVPAIWTRSDDPEHAAQIVAAAERTLTVLPVDQSVLRAVLLATIALESRGTDAVRGSEAVQQALEIARRLEDPALLAFALNGEFMQTFHRAGLAPRRDEIGAELIALSTRHGLVTSEVLGHLIRLQARSALADFSGANETPDPPGDLLFEAMWCLTARAAIAVGDRQMMERAHDQLLPAAGELAGAGSGLLTLGPVSRHLADLTAALR